MTLEDLYQGYYATEHEREWFEISAVDKARNILEFCGPLKFKRLLDIGAGSGAVTRRVIDGGLGEEIHAVEVSDSAIAELHKHLDGRASDIQKFDGLRLPYPDDSMDLAILSHVIEHVEHPRLLLYEAHRVARCLFVEVPLEDVPFKSNLHGDFVMDSTGHINYYNRHTIRRLLQTAGWKVLREELRHSSAATYRFRSGRKGTLQHAIKTVFLELLPDLSQLFFVYHSCLFCERGERLSAALGDVELLEGSGGTRRSP